MSRRTTDDWDTETKGKADHNGTTTERTQLLVPVSNIDVGRVQNEIRAQSPGLSPIIHEDDENIIVRRPVMYGSVSTVNADRAVSSRYRYYQRLDPQGNSNFIMPAHVVPEECYIILPIVQERNTQSSLVTIFSIWNTMMGTSILSMPWALEKAGFALGIFLMIFVAGLALYTAYRVIKSKDSIPLVAGGNLEFSDICRYYLGRPGEYISICFSVLSLLGATIVYWILLSNFLYNSVLFVYQKVNNEFNSSTPFAINNTHTDVYCPRGLVEPNSSHVWSSPSGTFPNSNVSLKENTLSGTSEIFYKVWNQTNTVPFFLIIVIIPLINFKSPTFFTKFNALGTVCVLYVMIFILVKGILWGVHMEVKLGIPEALPTFPALTGILALAYFIHNCIVSVMRNQRNPENNGRDLSIAYALVTFTYVFVGAFFFVCFPLPKRCIEDNLLNNFVNSDVMAFTARIFLFFQIVTVFPLLMFILRIQILSVIFGSIYPGLKHVLGLNVIIIIICLIFATQLPKIGTIIRFSGALCGFVYIFTLPCLVYLLILRKSSALTWPVILVHSVIIVLGFLNFVAQFVIFGQV